MTVRLVAVTGICVLTAWASEVPASEAGSWSGPYVGAFVGFGVGNMHMLYDSVTFEDDPATPEPDLVMVVHHRGGVSDHPINGLVFGAAAGVDASLSERVVAGLAVDVAVNNIEAVGGGGMTHPYRIGLDWHASLRGKIGLDEGTYLPYLTGGLAIAGGDYREGPRTASETHLGWTAGAGVEVYTSGNASIDMQYRYSDYRLQTYVIRNTGDFDLGYTTHAATVGVNWRF